MYIVVLCILLLLLPFCVCAADLYQIRPLSEADLTKVYANMMLDACRQADSEWHNSSFDPEHAGYWGDGWTDRNNQGTRAVSCMVFTSAALCKFSDIPKGAERKEMQRRAIAGIRYAVSTHLTGTQKCVDNKQWGNSWQSAMWTAPIAWAAWLLWDDLDADLQKGVERVVASEADRFLKVKPPSGLWGDTKAEENGWDLSCIAVAPNMFPNHLHAAAWREKAIEYMMNVLSTGKDKKDNTIVDGRPVSEWNCTENIHPDFTLENHNILHPSYMQCSSYFLTEAAMPFAYAKKPIPQAASHHLMDVWRTFQTILLPTGETAYPQGQDWELHGLNPINLFASLGTLMKDPFAAKMEKINIQYMRAWQQFSNGSLAVPGSPLGFTRSSIQSEQATWSFLAHKIFGPATEEPAPTPPDLVKHYLLVDMVMHRTASKFASFSWKNRVMGELASTAEEHESNPFFYVPIWNGFIGTTDLAGHADKKIIAGDHSVKKSANGFETTGTLQTNGGLLKQTLKMTSLGQKTVVYQDRITALSDVSVTREQGVPIGIENDQVTGGTRVVYYGDGKTTFDWQKPLPAFAVAGNWANVDGRLGIVTAAGSGMAYIQATGYNPQGLYADVLCASFSDKPRAFKASDEVAHRIAVYFLEVTPEETAKLSQSVKIADTPGGKVLHFTLPEGGEAEVPLL